VIKKNKLGTALDIWSRAYGIFFSMALKIPRKKSAAGIDKALE
jgi:hypothetical protein